MSILEITLVVSGALAYGTVTALIADRLARG